MSILSHGSMSEMSDAPRFYVVHSPTLPYSVVICTRHSGCLIILIGCIENENILEIYNNEPFRAFPRPVP